MGSSCTSEVFSEESQLTAPQESAKSSKVESRKKLFWKTKRSLKSVQPSHDNERSRTKPHRDAGSSRITTEVAPVGKTSDSRVSEIETVYTAEKSCSTADDADDFYEDDVENDFNTNKTDDNTTEDDFDINDMDDDTTEDDLVINGMDDDTTEDDLDNNEMDDDTTEDDLVTDDLDEFDSENDMDSDSILSSIYDGSSDTDEMEDSSSNTDMSSDSLETEQRICVLSDKEQMKTTPKEKTNIPPVKVQSRRCRCISSMMRRLGLRHSKSSNMRSRIATVDVAESTSSTSDDVVPDTVVMDENAVCELTPETNLNCEDRELCEKDQETSLKEGMEKNLVVVQSRMHRCRTKNFCCECTPVIAALRKLGIRCSINLPKIRRRKSCLMKTERASGTGDDLCKEDQKKTPQEDAAKQSLVVVQSRKWRFFHEFMRRLGFEGTKSQNNSEQSNIVILQSSQKACTSDDNDNKCPDSKDDAASISTSNTEYTSDPVEQEEAPVGTPRCAWEEKK